MNSPSNPAAHAPSQPESTPASTEAEVALLHEEVRYLKDRVAWFERQLFGRKSEKRIVDTPDQINLLGEPTQTLPEPEDTVTVSSFKRGKAKKQRPDDCATDTGLRFSEDVPVLERSIADVSLLAGLLVDKFQYHLPLYRQHQRMAQQGITVARSSLTNWVKRSIELLRPIVEAQCRHILLSRVLAMDETPIKAGRQHKGKLKQGWFWPLYGEDDEVVFTYSESRGRQHIENTLKSQFNGTLITDGHSAYARYAEKTQDVTHAQCWVHSRRYFVEAQERDPPAVAQALNQIGGLYQVERAIQEQKLTGDKKHQYRLEHSKPVVDGFFTWCQTQCQRHDLTPKHPLTKALNYVMARETQLRVFLADPDVPLDTNHLEREIRTIPMGRKNWLFCWTELGAEHVGLIQSLISTCKLHDINPQTYLIDVLQRVSQHPASQIIELTPRIWKEKFAGKPLRCPLYKSNEARNADQ